MKLMLIKYQSLKKETYGKYNWLKYFTRYNGNGVIRPLCLKLLKMTGYLMNLMKIKIQQLCLSGLTMNKFLKNIIKNGKRLTS